MFSLTRPPAANNVHVTVRTGRDHMIRTSL
jgi:hypothetical protein